MNDRDPATDVAERIRLLAVGGLAALAFTLPFELDDPWLRLGPLGLTNLEVVLIASLGLGGIATLRRGAAAGGEGPGGEAGGLPIPRTWLLLWLLFAAALLLSAWFAPEFRGNALKTSLRSISGIILAATVATVIRRRRDVLLLLTALCGAGLLSAGIGIAELLRGEEFPWLDAVRPEVTRVGPFLRLTGTFDYANTASMYLEATLPLLACLVWIAWRRRSVATAGLGLAILLLYLQADVLTYSRAGITTIFLSSLMVGVIVWPGGTPFARRLGRLWLSVAGLSALVLAANIPLNPVAGLRARLSAAQWYRLDLQAPERLELSAGDVTEVPVRVANRGAFSWANEGPHPVRLGGRWTPLNDAARPVGEFRWAFPSELAPGDSLRFSVPVRAPPRAGVYRLRWDVVQEGVAWFTDRTGNHVHSRVEVLEGDVAVEEDTAIERHRELDLAPPIPGRLTLWRIAVAEFADSPWLGIGSGNFRLVYGRRLGWSSWKETASSHNWYLETLVSAGLVGALPFFAWLILLATDIFRSLRERRPDFLRSALAAALLAFLIHGLVDHFLLFHATGLLFWLLVGLWIPARRFPRPRSGLRRAGP